MGTTRMEARTRSHRGKAAVFDVMTTDAAPAARGNSADRGTDWQPAMTSMPAAMRAARNVAERPAAIANPIARHPLPVKVSS